MVPMQCIRRKDKMHMSPYFYSLGMLVTSRGWKDSLYLSAMDLLAMQIADDELPLHPFLKKLPQFAELDALR